MKTGRGKNAKAEFKTVECELISGPDKFNKYVILHNNKEIHVEKGRLTPINKVAKDILTNGK